VPGEKIDFYFLTEQNRSCQFRKSELIIMFLNFPPQFEVSTYMYIQLKFPNRINKI